MHACFSYCLHKYANCLNKETILSKKLCKIELFIGPHTEFIVPDEKSNHDEWVVLMIPYDFI
jgi:hypothetical protein